MDSFLDEPITELVDLFRPYITGVRSVLDIGTGTSIPIHIFAGFFNNITFQTADIEDNRQRKELPFIIYDGITLPFRDKEFDVSVLNETLHHCEDPETVLKEAHRVAKAVFVVEHFPDPGVKPEEIIEEEFSILRILGLDCGIYNPFNEDSLFNLFRETGLTIKNKFEVPYHGKRKIKKYFFKLVGDEK
jgi:SAM-dependent methyltransferase